MQLPNKRKANSDKSKGSKFLTDAKNELIELFDTYEHEKSEEIEELADFMQALFDDSWSLVERVCKESWHNGVARGRQARGQRPSGE